ncbi:L-carnitine dehydratase/bile acid-inducible protein F [Burkholderia ambifaria MC40-6]|uniref:L-carnitine dehydratase/bile acid-inducible protein F n=1 Tax=Burkholderia ambifaria (strain MC40-6) TaxID=398577 RepID=B1Z4A0_BURA4|nr:CoA transferase [Burkholderia ambifaria]ACB68563.1 L-carnitine dehydratase/bile acid-inducible protein F [Burkholderia ambifaria MC40-6]
MDSGFATFDSGTSARPLAGIRIIDLTRVVSGPFATMHLADLGADVIKIEEPTSGDDSRAFGPPFVAGESAYFLSVNRNKRSCAIDLKSDAGRQILLRMIETADVVVDNFRPGAMKRLGLDHETLRSINPRLICCSISGFGSQGPDAQRPGYDLIVQGEAGVMDITGDPSGQPTKVGTSIADMIAGLFAVQGILSALYERNRTGVARSVQISMLDALASLLTFNAGIYFSTGSSPTRRGNEHPTICPYETFQASDGWINLGVANDKFWKLFCEVANASDLVDDPCFATAPLRVSNRHELRPLVAALLRGNSRAYWVEKLGNAGVPCGLIRTVGEVCEAAQLTERGMILSMDHPIAGVVKNITNPVRLDDAPMTHASPPPMLGQHTREILESLLGLSAHQLDELAARGVIRDRAEQTAQQ